MSIPICIMDNPCFFNSDIFIRNIQNMIVVF